MTQLRDLFHKPATLPIGGVNFRVSKLGFDQFEDAIAIGTWLTSLEEKSFSLAQLNTLKAGTPERAALERLLAGCLALADLPDLVDIEQVQRDWPIKLQPADVAAMPVMMVAEAVAVVLEVNTDFFFQTLPKLLQAANRMRLTGSVLLSSLSAPGTASSASGVTP